MPDAAAIREWISRIRRDLDGLEAALASNPKPPSNGADDFSDFNLLDSCSASARYTCPQDQLRRWCRESANSESAIGIRRGGRWLISIPRLRAKLNGSD